MITEHEIASDRLTMPRRARVHTDSVDALTDCLVFLDGELYTDRVKAPDIIREAQAAGSLPRLKCIYFPNVSAAGRHADYTCNEDFASFIALDLPRWIEREAGRFHRLFLCGLSLSGLQAVFTAMRHPGVFSGVLSQSPSAWWNDEALTASFTLEGSSPNRIWMSVGTQELQENVFHPPTNLHQKSSQRESVHRLIERMKEAGYEVRSHEYEGGHDCACWGTELPQALAWLLDT